MKTTDDRYRESPRDLETFETELRRWGRREPTTSGPQAVAHLRRRMDEGVTKEPVAGWRRPAVAWSFALALAVGAGLLAVSLLDRLTDDRPGIDSVADRPSWQLPADLPQDAAPTDGHPTNEGVVLLWLDETTPLYMTFEPPSGPREKGPS